MLIEHIFSYRKLLSDKFICQFSKNIGIISDALAFPQINNLCHYKLEKPLMQFLFESPA